MNSPRGPEASGAAERDPMGGLGVEIDADGIRLGLADRRGRIRYRHFASIEVCKTRVEDLARTLVRLVNGALQSADEMNIRTGGVCVVVPAHVDPEMPVVRHAAHLGWRDLPLADLLPADEITSSAPIALQSTARASALAESRARPDELRDFLYLSSSGGGTGGALILNGSLHRGASGRAGELGHVVVDPAGPPCPCGGTGCLDVRAGISAILRTAGLSPRGSSSDAASVDQLIDRLKSGERHARAAVAEAGMHFGTALAMAARTIDPAAVVVGGAYARLLEWLQPTAIAALELHAPDSPLLGQGRITASVLGADAALIGAVAAAVAPSVIA